MKIIEVADGPRAGAQGRLDRLSRCRAIRPWQLDEDLVCANDMIALERVDGAWMHSATEIQALRDRAEGKA